MSQQPCAKLLGGGKRLHLQHGPIDLIIGAEGTRAAIAHGYSACRDSFATVLHDLAGELPLLRTPVHALDGALRGAIARRMLHATAAHSPVFVTPMAAVAGAVADHMLEVLAGLPEINRAYVNNGGDIALYLNPGMSFCIGIVSDVKAPSIRARIGIDRDDEIGGIATSGWQGRSHSLGIADAVTVLAETAAQADVAATLIANAVDLPGSRKVTRTAARSMSPDSDLEDRLVTIDVAPLSPSEKHLALNRGKNTALAMRKKGLLKAAFLSLQGEIQVLEPPLKPFMLEAKPARDFQFHEEYAYV